MSKTSLRSVPSDPSPLQRREIAAAIVLLADDSKTVVAGARECLRQYGERARSQLEQAAADGGASTRVRARELLRALELRQCLRRMLALDLDRRDPCRPAPLLAGAVLSSHLVRTFAPDAPQLARRLRREAAVVRARFAGRSLLTCARLLSDHFVGTLGFRGSDGGRLELDHVLIDRVLEHRVGVPVTLSLLWLLVARSAGLSVSGVAMPEHFLVRLHGVRPVLVDPFHGGRTVTKVDCIRHLRSIGCENVRDYVRDLSDREVLAHYLRHLRRAAVLRAPSETQETLRDALFHLEAN